jgi:DNA primase
MRETENGSFDTPERRAAYRAVDLALPLLKPGKSLRFASLPEGHDPDDLVRTGGREAVAEVVAAARPLVDIIWQRETEAGSIDTPERRAALQAHLGEIAASIGDETVRYHYRQEFNARLRRLFEGERPQAGRRSFDTRSRAAGPGRWSKQPLRLKERFRMERSRPAAVAGEPYVVASPQLTTSPVHRGHRAASPRREALILQAAVNHPWLLHDHLEDFAGLEFRHPETEQAKAALIDVFAHDAAVDVDAVRAQLEARGLGELIARIERAITTPSVWGAQPNAAADDVVMTWTQLIALHRQRHSLIKELKDAEQALGQDATEANYSWLRDVKTRLSALDGTEALIEGFGVSSGRAATNF